MRLLLAVCLVVGAEATCDSEDQAAINGMGGGSAAGSFPKASADCASHSLTFHGIDEEKFNTCLKESSGAKQSCTDCYWQAADYGFKHCKLSCLASWCSSACLDCNADNTETVNDCAGFAAPEPTSCDADAFAMEADVEWNAFKNLFNRHYTSLEHEKARYWIFKSNIDFMKTHNAKESTYKMGINDFSDLTPSEFAESHFGFKKPEEMWPGVKKLGTHYAREGEVLASSVDWTTQGAVTPVKNQGQCGSCWSFSTTGALEGAWEIATGNLVSVSEQQFVDCSKQNSGCSGGLMDYAFAFAETTSLCTEGTYAYTASDGVCSPGGCTVAIPKGGVTGFTDVDQSEAAMMSAVNLGPVSVAIEADQSAFQSYTSGVLQGDCGTQLDHGVLNVGYGTDNGVDYWKVKNSWGATWGESGYIRMLRGKNSNGECGILMSASYPQVDGSAPPSPAPAPSPTPAPQPPGSYYEHPPCGADEVTFTLNSNGHEFCSPQCDANYNCPAATTGTASCAISYGGAYYCVDQCTSASDCPSGGICESIGWVDICTFAVSSKKGGIDVSMATALPTVTV